MQKQIYAKINPKILEWMRKSSNLSVDEVTRKSKIKKQLLLEAEKVDSILTIKQLRKLAQIYSRPLSSFYLNEIPEDIQLPDFRTPYNKEVVITGELNTLIREFKEKKKFAEELSRLENITNDYSFIGKFNENDSNSEISSFILKLLKIDRDEISKKRDNDILNLWKEKIESLGILVFQFQKIDLLITRGFSFSDPPMPIIILNQKDTYYARVFTLIHELAHILLNSVGICDSNEKIEPENRIESKCNAIASLTLVPKDEFEEQLKIFPKINKEINLVLESLSRYFKTSWSVILIRLKELELITQNEFLESKNYLQKKQKSKSQGGNYYTLLLSSESKTYYKMVFNALNSDKISFNEAMNYLNVSYKVLRNLEQKGAAGEF